MEATDGRTRAGLDAMVALALVAIAVAMRAWRIGWGLPDLAEEAIPLQLGFAMRSLASGRIDVDPRWFHDPSLGIYLHLLVQQGVYLAGRLAGAWTNAADYRLAFDLDPTPMVLAARALGIACDALAVLAAWRIGRRFSRAAGLVAALLVAVSPSYVTTARSIVVDPVMACLALWAIERMLAWRAEGGYGRFVGAALLAGFAAGTRYPAVALSLPIGALVFAREGRRGLPLAALAAGIAGAAFLLTTPYAVLDFPAFARDLGSVAPRTADGHPTGPAFALAILARDLGWPALAALVLSPLVAWRDRSKRDVVIASWLMMLGFAVPLAFARTGSERDLLPVLAAAGVMVALTTASLVARVPERARNLVAVVTCALIVAMPIAAGVSAARNGTDDTRSQARRWCESHIRRDELVVTEGHGPRLVDEDRLAELHDLPAYRLASPAWKSRVDRLEYLHVVVLPLGVPGRLTNPLALAGLPPVTLEVAPQVSALDRVHYEPALYTDADYVITNSAVRGRYAADPVSFTTQCRLYHALDRDAPIAARFIPGAGVNGPEIVVYHLDDHARAALGRRGALDPLWWTAAIPTGYRRFATRLLAAERQVRDSLLSAPTVSPRRAASGAFATAPRPLAVPELPAAAMTPDSAPAPGPRDHDGDAAPWVRSLRPLYQTHVASFAAEMAHSLAMLGHYDGAAHFAEANLVMMPEDVSSCLLASVSLGRTQRWPAARATIERTLAVLDPQQVDPALTLQYARALAHTAEPARARVLDQGLIDTLPKGDPIAAAAAADLARLP